MTATPAIARPFFMWVDKASKTEADARALSSQPYGMLSIDMRLVENAEPKPTAVWFLESHATEKRFAALQDAITAAKIVSRKPLADPNKVDYKTGEVYLSDADNTSRSWLLSSTDKPARGKTKAAIDLAASLREYIREGGLKIPV